jgi:hypothetical protein
VRVGFARAPGGRPGNVSTDVSIDVIWFEGRFRDGSKRDSETATGGKSMPIRRHVALLAFVGLATAFVLSAPGAAQAQNNAGKKKTEGCMVSYDAAAGNFVVRDEKSKKEETFKVKQGTSVLDKTGTAVAKNGRGAKLVDLEANRPVIVYWAAQGEDKFASKIDAPDPMDSDSGKLDADIMEQAGCKME